MAKYYWDKYRISYPLKMIELSYGAMQISNLNGFYGDFNIYQDFKQVGELGSGDNLIAVVSAYSLYQDPSSYVGKVAIQAGIPQPTNLLYRLQDGLASSSFRNALYIQQIEDETNPSKGALVTSNILAEENTYPLNGPHTDRFWYVRGEMANDNPVINVTSPIDERTLYENDVFDIAGSVSDTNIGDVVTVKYLIDGGAAQAISAIVSTGKTSSFAKNLTYKSGKLYDGTTAITDILVEGRLYNLKIWAEDDNGGKSKIILRSFYVVPNRPAKLTFDAFVTSTGLINTDVVNVAGSVVDLDNGNVIVKYKIGNGAFVQVFDGVASSTPTAFDFNIMLADLVDGPNQITIQAIDAVNAVTQAILILNKTKTEQPLLTAVTYYEITPPNETSNGVILWIEREIGDLKVTVDIFMGAKNETETFIPMTLDSTAYLTNELVEDTFKFDNEGVQAEKIIVRITQTRTATTENKAINKISGVLS